MRLKEQQPEEAAKIDTNFKKDVFEKKVQQHIKCGYSKENAEWKVLGDYNRRFLNFMGVKPNRKETDTNGYYITKSNI